MWFVLALLSAVFAALTSILAKVARDRAMKEYDILYPEYGFAQHKGYGTADHIAAIIQHGMCPIHREKFCKTALSPKGK